LNKKIPREFWIVTLVFVSMLAVLSIAVAFGGLSLRVFAVLAVLLMVFPFLRYWSLFRLAAKEQQQSKTETTTDALRSTIRSAKVRIGVLIALTCLAIWETKSGPLVPCLIGLGFLLLLLSGNILSLQQARRMFEQLNSGE
jgi:sterol desaturase/sphingolipid hydroxylase (fatty acid hydroxylase superfamily)